MYSKSIVLSTFVLCAFAAVAEAQEPTSIRMLHWNVQYSGTGTDGIVDRGRQVTWIANQRPDLVALNELTAPHATDYRNRLQTATGSAWHLHFASAVSGKEGNAILSRFPLLATTSYRIRAGSATRSVTHARIAVGDAEVNVFATHLDNGDRPDQRAAQV